MISNQSPSYEFLSVGLKSFLSPSMTDTVGFYRTDFYLVYGFDLLHYSTILQFFIFYQVMNFLC